MFQSLKKLSFFGFLCLIFFGILGTQELLAQCEITNNSPGTHTFTVPAGVTQITIEAWGGGGKGGTRTNNGGGGGGGGGGYSRSIIAVTPGTTYSYVVGAGGSSSGTYNGASTRFYLGATNLVLANGGLGVSNNSSGGVSGGSTTGAIGNQETRAGGNGAAGTGSNGGGGGSSGNIAQTGIPGSGTSGGISPSGVGHGGDGSTSPSNGEPGILPGGGGGGAVKAWYTSSRNGGDGANGQIQITFRPEPTFTVSPTTNVCEDVEDVTYTTQSDAAISNYVWSLPGTLGTDYSIISGGTGSGNSSVTVRWLTPGSKTVSVNYTVTAYSVSCDGAAPASSTVIVDPITRIDTDISTSAPPAVCEGGSFPSLSVVASGTGTLSYQWYSNTSASTSGGTPVGTDSPSYTPLSGTPGDLYYYVEVTGDCGPIATSSLSGIHTVNPLTTIDTQPVGDTYCQNDTPSDLSVAASGTGTITYEWFSNTSNSTTGASSVGTGATFTPPTNTAGSLFYFAVASSPTCGDATSDIVEIIVNPETVIGTQPVGDTYCQNDTPADLSVAASGTGTITYEWFSNTSNSTTGASSVGTGPTFTPPTNTAGSIFYFAVATSPTCGDATSDIVEIIVNPETVIGTQPVADTYCQNDTPADLSVAATGTGTITYEWFSNTSNSTTGASSVGTGPTFTPPTNTAGSLFYFAVASSPTCGDATSDIVEIIVNPETVIGTQPVADTYCQNDTPTDLSVAATGTGTITYEWFSNTSNSTTGASSVGTGPTFTPPTNTAGSIFYFAVATSPTCGDATSDIVEIIVNPETVIGTQPTTTNQTGCIGDSFAPVSVFASGTGGLTYQWYSNTSPTNSGGSLISGATSNSFTPPSSTEGTLYYYVEITGSCGSLTSNISGSFTVNPSTNIDSENLGTQAICDGGTFAPLTITATGTGTLHYQWYENSIASTSGATVVGTDSPTFTPPSASLGTLYYFVIVSSDCGTDITSSISGPQTVQEITAITTQPDNSDDVECYGDGFDEISISAVGSGLTYQWYSNSTASTTGGTAVPGATSPNFTPPSISLGINYYYVIVTGNCGSETSTISGQYWVTNPSTSITTNPDPGSYITCFGGSFSSLYVSAVGEGTVTYQWYSNTSASNTGGTAISGETGNSFTPPTDYEGTFYYYATASSDCGTVPTAVTGAYTVTPLTEIDSEDLVAETICEGGTFAPISVVADGTSPITYQWYSNSSPSNSGGTAISGANSDIYYPPTTSPGITTYYYIEVTSSCGGTVISNISGALLVNPNTSIDTDISTSAPPAVCEGGSFPSLSVVASGTGTLSYQWYSNTSASTSGGTPVGSDSPSYTPLSGTPGDLYYYVEVTGDCGPIATSSLSGIHTVNPLTTIDTQPVGDTYCQNDTPSDLSVAASGTGTITYEWFSNTSNSTAGASSVGTGATFTPPTNTAGSLFYFAVTSSPTCGDATSDIVEIIVNPETVIGTQPVGDTYCQNDTPADLSVAATGTGTITYEWFSNTSNSTTGASSVGTGPTFTPPTNTAGSIFYFAVASSPTCGDATSDIVEIIVNPETVIGTQPVGDTYCQNDTPTDLSVAASGTGTITYEWFSNTSNSTTGASSVGTGPTFTPPTNTAGSLFYFAVASSPTCGDATSDIVEIIVNPETVIGTQPVGDTYCQNDTPTDLSVAASGTGTITYEWFSNTSNSTVGASSVGTGPTFTPPTNTAGSIFYFAVASSPTCGDATSDIVEINIIPTNTVTPPSITPELCINTPLTSISHSTTGATGILAENDTIDYNLPSGVSANWVSDIITISGTPTEEGIFNYSIPLTGGCGDIFAEGTITVTDPSYPISGINVINPALGDPVPATSTFTVYSPGLTLGTYDINYSRSGVNGGPDQTISITVTTPGEFTFTSPSYSNEGSTILTINSIQKSTDLCPDYPSGSKTVLYGISCSVEFDRVNGNQTFYVPANVSQVTIQVFGNGTGGSTAIQTMDVWPSGVIFAGFSGSDVFATEIPESEPVATRIADAIAHVSGPNGKVKFNYICDSTIPSCASLIDDGNFYTDSEGYTVIRFDNIGTCTWTAPDGLSEFEVLVIAGGGGGGYGSSSGGGGGGGDAIYREYSGISTSGVDGLQGASFTIQVGSGGIGGSGSTTRGVTGNASSFSGGSFDYTNIRTSVGGSLSGAGTFGNLTSSGGGGGGSTGSRTGRNGGSGGGAGAQGWFSSGTAGTGTGENGNNGGGSYALFSTAGGGGGGAGGAGNSGTNSLFGIAGIYGGNGGDGLPFDFSGTTEYYSAGGGGTSSGEQGAGGSAGAGGNAVSGGTGQNGQTYGSGGGAGSSGGGDGFQGVVYIRYPNFKILSVEYLYFIAEYNQTMRTGELKWSTSHEWENDHFEIERSVNDVSSWEKIGEIQGAGYSDSPKDYSFRDSKLPLAGGNIFYRLKQVNFEGNSTFSITKSIQVEPVKGTTYWRVFPNPTTGYPFDIELLDLGGYHDEPLIMRIISSSGQVSSFNVTDIKIMGELISDWFQSKAAGVYTLEISWGDKKEYHKVILKR